MELSEWLLNHPWMQVTVRCSIGITSTPSMYVKLRERNETAEYSMYMSIEEFDSELEEALNFMEEAIERKVRERRL